MPITLGGRDVGQPRLSLHMRRAELSGIEPAIDAFRHQKARRLLIQSGRLFAILRYVAEAQIWDLKGLGALGRR